MKRKLNQKLSSNEVYYTNSSITLVKYMLCSKTYCQKGCILMTFSYKITQTHSPSPIWGQSPPSALVISL